MPFEHLIGRICEEFGDCLPSVAIAEWERLPAGFIETLLEYRAYARARHVVTNAQSRKDIPRGVLYGLAVEIEMAIAQEEIDGRSADD